MRISDWSSDVCSSDLVVIAGGEVLEAAEAVRAVKVATVQVEHVVALVVDTALDDVVAGVIGAGDRRGKPLGVDLVLVAVVVLADEDRTTVLGSDLDFGLVDRVAVALVEGLLAQLDLGGEGHGPVDEQLQRGVLGAFVHVLPKAGPTQRKSCA